MNRANRLAALEQAANGGRTIYTIITGWEWPGRDMQSAREQFVIEHGTIPDNNTVIFVGFGA